MSLAASGACASRRLLIVGDPASSRGLMTMVLGRLGYAVTCVDSGREALDALKRERFALVLVALQLPDLPGLTLARRLRTMPERAGGLPIILFGDAPDPERLGEECHAAGLDAFLPKPISIGRLVATVRALVARTSPQPGGAAPMADSTTPIALEHLTSFTDGDPQLERELGLLYLASAGLYLEELRAALRNGGDWRGAAHSLKGASANIGAVEVAALAAKAEKAAPSPELVRCLAEAVEAVRRFFDERHGAAAMTRNAPSLEA